MTPTAWGALAGLGAGLGLVLVVLRVVAIRRPSLADRVLPYLRDLPQIVGQRPLRGVPVPGVTPGGVGWRALLRRALWAAAQRLDRALGGTVSLERRMRQAGSGLSAADFRVQQVVWGLVGFGLTAAWGVLQALGGSRAVITPLVLCLLGALSGVLLADQQLSRRIRTRQQQILAEFPTLAELLALAVAAGEGPVTALERVVRRSNGALADDLGRVLAAIRVGEPVGRAFDDLAATTAVPSVARFAQALAVALDRGTPLADVLHAQAADVREAGRRDLIEIAARREIAMMVPVVFLILPVTVLFAFYPGVFGLSLTT